MTPNSLLLLLLHLCFIFSLASANFEDLSTPEIEQILKELDYEEDAYRSGYDYDPSPVDYNYPDYPSSSGLMPRSADDEIAQIRQIKQVESLNHGIPAPEALSPSAPRVTSGGTTKTNTPPKGSSTVLPAYCDPPNPCPIGYTSKDGCIDNFDNTSEFSREYQSRQNCLCDSEHMFDCPANRDQQKDNEQDGFLAGLPPSLESSLDNSNPFLGGTKLPIAAKKGFTF